MADLIDRKAVLTAIANERQYLINRGLFGAEHILVHHAIDVVEEIPTIEAEPVKHGKWIVKESLLLCSKCGRPTEDRHDVKTVFDGNKVIARVYPFYCGFCGAKMDDDVKDDEP